nr:immunoglobulin light chain junction region [Macaca mulatta]MOX28558.1 immunoglobulin light chain junction region [Macaca mulatta]MOX28713.1 immunoglobulin light chain junction region [Macaca mulatta]MOX28968.1 immunoglobulin light chain junction region [Macaca mulatta]MOX29222.1 immunoglobulin light chain junction region [Macaca mulatta]
EYYCWLYYSGAYIF